MTLFKQQKHNLIETLAILRTAQAEIEKSVAEKIIKRALKAKNLPATKFLINPWDHVRAC